MVKISFLGGCREVGRSAILIESDHGEKCVLDYGVRFTENDRLPYDSNLSNLKAVALTHCHIDHSGGLPYLFKKFNVPLYINPLTLRITEILLKDMIKVSKFPYPFGYREIEKIRQNTLFLENQITKKISEDFYITFYNAGHIPGSVSILVEVDEKKILYTGDINLINTNLIYPADTSIDKKIDAIITESTYALREHPSRNELEKKFVEEILNVSENGGRVLIPAFGVARSQEILLILNKYGLNGQIYMDGLARKVGVAYSNFPLAFRDFGAYKRSLKKVQFVSEKMRKKVGKKSRSIIISPSGMLKGGAAIDYLKLILDDPQSAIYMVGYQVEGTPGRKLLEEKVFEYQSNNIKNDMYKIIKKADCIIDYYDFSSHADRTHLLKYLYYQKFNNNSKFVFCVHGDDKATTLFARDLANEGFNSVAPETGEIYKI
ncbi:MAG: MBL fold metallo-hydrolase [Candidatus Heimdallarchaeota archaeon]